jgi:Esterase-like activity of phytase
MANRAGVVCAFACATGLWLGLQATVALRAQQVARVIQVAELPDVGLGEFYNGLFRFPIDRIVDDHGVRFGSLGSDIFHDPADSYNEFWAVTDRGPNGNPGRRTFLAPAFSPLILRFRVQDDRIEILSARPIVDASDRPVTGLSNVPGFDEIPYDFAGTNVIDGNPNGLDTEGLVRTQAGRFWMVDEYSPSLILVDQNGRVAERYVPEGSALATTLATTPNYLVKKYLPPILNFRRQNRGFEGIAMTSDERTLFLAMQSPLDYPTSALGRASRNVRIFRFDTLSERITGEFVYRFDEVCAFLAQSADCGVAPGEMKISGLIALSPTSLLVEERTDTAAKIYRVDLSGATNILGTVWDAVAPSPSASTPALESLPDPSSQGVVVMPKSLVVNLSILPGVPNKIEGIALVRPDVLAVVNDNDFGLVDNATFTAAGRLSNDTLVRSKLLYIHLASPVN